MKQKWQALMAKLEGSRLAPLVQFVKFGLVGVSNTLISYAVDMLCYYVLFANVPWGETTVVFVTSAISFIVSVTNSYYWNNRYVFGGGKKTIGQHAWTYLKTVLCYALTGLVLAPLMKDWLVARSVPFWAASPITLIVTIPLNFVMNKFFAFGKKKAEKTTE